MQINRTNGLVFPPTSPPTSTPQPAAPATPAAPPPVLTARVTPQESGVIYTNSGSDAAKPAAPSSADLSNMTLENQLELGRNMGVFTKITLSKDGVLVATPHRAAATTDAKPAEFVAAAVSTMRDFEEGITALRGGSAEAHSKTRDFLTSKLRGLQQAASKLNVFA